MSEILSIRDLEVRFGSHRAVSGVAIDLMPGDTVGLLGPNGAGKSTVLHSIVGLAAPHTGEITVCGAAAGTPAAVGSIGFAPDDLPTPLSLTGCETIALTRRLRGAAFDLELAHWMAKRLDLAAHLHRPVGGYSHGMRRKLQLVCAVGHRPAMLLLDEPMRGLDPEAAAVLRAVMEGQAESGGAVLMATHDLDGAAAYCDRIVIMAKGREVASGSVAHVQSQAPGASTLTEAFLVLSGLAERVAMARAEMVDRLGSVRSDGARA